MVLTQINYRLSTIIVNKNVLSEETTVKQMQYCVSVLTRRLSLRPNVGIGKYVLCLSLGVTDEKKTNTIQRGSTFCKKHTVRILSYYTSRKLKLHVPYFN